MTAAQYVLAALTAVLVAAGTVLVIFEETTSGWILLGFALFAFVIVMGMVASDAQAARRE